MPKFPKGLNQRPQTKAAPPPSREALLRSALAGILRRLGLVGHVVPADLALIALAKDFVDGGSGLADDRGNPVDVETWSIKDVLSPPNPSLDDDIPF